MFASSCEELGAWTDDGFVDAVDIVTFWMKEEEAV
jgi:hypothetical protein